MPESKTGCLRCRHGRHAHHKRKKHFLTGPAMSCGCCAKGKYYPKNTPGNVRKAASNRELAKSLENI